MQRLLIESRRARTAIWEVSITQRGAAYPIAAETFTFAAKLTADAADPIFTKTLGDGITVLDGPGGVIQIELPPADTEALENSKTVLLCDLMMTAGGRKYQVAEGRLTVEPSIAQ